MPPSFIWKFPNYVDTFWRSQIFPFSYTGFNDLRTTISHIAARVECCNQIAEKTMPSQDTSYILCGIFQAIHRYIYQRSWPGKLRTHPTILTVFHKTTRIRHLHQCSLRLCRTSLRAWLWSWHIYHQFNLHIRGCQFALPDFICIDNDCSYT
jgi:hypothetical protein